MQTETNRYAQQVTDQKQHAGVHLSPRSKFRTWKNVTVDEMTSFLAIAIHTGIVKKLRIVDYWSKNPVLQTTFASKLTKRDRFRAILSFSHLNDNTTYVPRNNPNHDPLHKLCPLIDHLIHVSFSLSHTLDVSFPCFCSHLRLLRDFWLSLARSVCILSTNKWTCPPATHTNKMEKTRGKF